MVEWGGDVPLAEGRRVIAAAEARGLLLRLLGGVAVQLHAPSASAPPLARAPADLDFVLAGGRGDQVEALLNGLGYQPDRAFNLYQGDRRLLFADATRQVDVFVGGFQMCHALPMPAERLRLEPLTVPLAELLLTKMQIVQLNRKDLLDLCALLLDHPWGEGDVEQFNLSYLTELCGRDWGLWRTVQGSIAAVRTFLPESGLAAASQAQIAERLGAFQTALAQAPKSLRWKARAAIGDRLPWYELPEEVHRGPADG